MTNRFAARIELIDVEKNISQKLDNVFSRQFSGPYVLTKEFKVLVADKTIVSLC